MSDWIIYFVWLGGYYGAGNAGVSTWQSVFWPYYVAKVMVAKCLAS